MLVIATLDKAEQLTVSIVVTDKEAIFLALQPSIRSRENTSSCDAVDMKFDWVLT